MLKNKTKCDDERVDLIKTLRPTKPSNLISTVLSRLALCHFKLKPRHGGRVGQVPERFS